MTGESYLLPASMGGHKCEITWRSSRLVAGVEIAKVRYTIDGFEVTSEVLLSWLTPVKPALPEQPPIGCWFWAGANLWRHSNSPTPVGQDPVDAETWMALRDGAPPRSWRQLVVNYLNRWPGDCEILWPQSALPDPLAGEPVTLPWSARVGTTTAVEVSLMTVNPKYHDRPVYFGLASGAHMIAPQLTFDEAEDIARALLTARAVWAAANQNRQGANMNARTYDQRDNLPWEHEDDSRCTVFWSDKRPPTGVRWWCTVHQKHMRIREPANQAERTDQ